MLANIGESCAPGREPPAKAWKATARELASGKNTPVEPRGASPPPLGDGRAVFRLEAVEAVVTSSLTTTGKAEQVAPNVLSIAARTASAFSRASCTQRPHASTGELC